MLRRRSLEDVVTLPNHEDIGARCVGQYGDGVIRKVQMCALWEGLMYGIEYDEDSDVHEIGEEAGELQYEEEADVEILEGWEDPEDDEQE